MGRRKQRQICLGRKKKTTKNSKVETPLRAETKKPSPQMPGEKTGDGRRGGKGAPEVLGRRGRSLESKYKKYTLNQGEGKGRAKTEPEAKKGKRRGREDLSPKKKREGERERR